MKRSAGVGAGWEEGMEGVEGKSARDRIIQLPRLNFVAGGARCSARGGENGSERASERGAEMLRPESKKLLRSLSGGELL